MPDKNIRSLAGHPVMVCTIAAALESGIFSDVIVIFITPPRAIMCADSDRFLIRERCNVKKNEIKVPIGCLALADKFRFLPEILF